MTTQIPYITIEHLDGVLNECKEANIITDEQQAAISGKVENHVDCMIQKTKEEKKTNALRQECLSLAKRISSRTTSAIDEQKRQLRVELETSLTSERSRREVNLALIRADLKNALSYNQEEMDALYISLRKLTPGEAEHTAILEKRMEITRQRSMLRMKADEKMAAEYQQYCDRVNEIKQRISDKMNDAETRLRAAISAHELTRSIILNASPEDLPGILDSLNGKEGGAA